LSEIAKAPPAKARLVVITGLSGSGKSVVAKCFEDLSYYTVDNLPLPLLRAFLDNPLELVRGNDRIAVVTDVRAPGFAEEFPRLFAEIDRERIEPRLLFLETSDEVLVRRFSETRRPHPLAPDRPVIEGIRRAVSFRLSLPPHNVVLIAPRTIPRTSSGKVQRWLCRQQYLAGDLQEICRWQSPAEPATARASAESRR